MSATVPLLDSLRHLPLLEPAQLDEVERTLHARFPEPKDLARELLQRSWLTAYQANLLLQGRGDELVLGSYIILERLGEGGMGQVFRARHARLDRVVALKLVRKERLANPDAIRRFHREIRAAAQLNHPNIVLAFDAGEVDGKHFFTMEFVAGIDLARHLREQGPLRVAEACDYIRQAACGLAHAHERGLIHRDIKPANLLLTSNGVVKILDMGLARLEQSADGDASSLVTQEGVVMGSLDYLAPEQAMDAHHVDIRADLYSLGCTFYHLLTGSVPFSGGTAAQKIYKHQFAEPTPVEQRRPEIPAEVAAIVRKLMAKKPEDRYQTPAEVIAAMERASGGRRPPEVAHLEGLTAPNRLEETQTSGERWEVAADPANTAVHDPAGRQRFRRRVVILVSATAAALMSLLAVLGYGLFSGGQGQPAPTKTQARLPEEAFARLPGMDYYTNSCGMHFVKLRTGRLRVGGGDGNAGTQQIEQDLYLGVFEVTQRQWQTVMGNNPSFFSRTGGGKDKVENVADADLAQFPVEQVSWRDCQEFIKRLNEREQGTSWVYRLPLPVEWEYACRGGGTIREEGGFDFCLDRPTNDLSSLDANFDGQNPAGKAARGPYLERTTKVGSYPANRLGIYDMHGNVWEWCEAVNPRDSLRMIRGGSWLHRASECRITSFVNYAPGYQYYTLGLRVARVPIDKPALKPPEPRPLAKLPGKDYYTNSMGMHFVKVPAGTFWMGGGDGKSGTNQVKIEKDFYLGVYEVTQQQWQIIMGTNPSAFSRNGADKAKVMNFADADLQQFPVESVSWDDAREFIKRLDEREKDSGWTYRLPTEAEWEYACRGGSHSKEDGSFSYYLEPPTNQLMPSQANFNGNKLGRTVEVGSYPPNRLGLYDMHGNVYEWCQDAFGGIPGRVLRGGSWFDTAADCRAAVRNGSVPSARHHSFGLRLACVPPERFRNSIGMAFVKVPKGTFWMGGGGGKPGTQQVSIEKDFYLGVFEVTQGQWQAVMGNSPSLFSRTGSAKDKVKDVTDADLAQFPVEQVSWDDCQEFIRRLSEREEDDAWVYRLPREAEWEYACRGGATSPDDCSFHFYLDRPTNDLSSLQANFNGTMPGGQTAVGPFLQRTTRVGSYPPNRFGIYDMHGNVWEWCDDLVGAGPKRVNRGGGYYDKANECRATYRPAIVPSERRGDRGFRLARVPASK